MPNIVRFHRTNTPGFKPTGMTTGEIWVNLADLQLGVNVGDTSLLSTPGTPRDLIAIRYHSSLAAYNAGDMVARQGGLWEANAAIPPGAWNASQWTLIAGSTTPGGSQAFLPLAGGVMTGQITTLTPGAATDAANKGYVDGRQAAWVATVAPPMNGTAAVGSSALFSRQDHVHPTDTTRAPATGGSYVAKAGDTMTGALTVNTTIAMSASGQGGVQLNPGGASNTGYVSFWNSAGTRCGYLGYAAGGNLNLIANEGSSTTLSIGGAVSASGAMTVGGALTVNGSTGCTVAYNLQVNGAINSNATIGCNGINMNGGPCRAGQYQPDNGGAILMYGNCGFYSDANYVMYGHSGQPQSSASWRFYYTKSNGYRNYVDYQGTNCLQIGPTGQCICPGGFATGSDASLKRDIKPATIGMEAIRKITPSYFHRIYNEPPPGQIDLRRYDRRELGFIAQDVQEALPDAITVVEHSCPYLPEGETDPDKMEHIESTYLAVEMMPMLAALTNAVKELDKRLAAIESGAPLPKRR